MISSISIHILPLDLSITTCSNFLLSAIMSDTLPRNQQACRPAPLRREGAMIFPSPGPALEDAMSRPSALPPVSSVSANSQLRRTSHMDTIPVAGPGQPPPLANNSISDARLQNAQRNLTPQPDGNNTPTTCDSDPGTLSQLSSGMSTVSTPTATPLAFDPDNLYKVTVTLYSISDFLADYLLHVFYFIQGLLGCSKGGQGTQGRESDTAQHHCSNGRSGFSYKGKKARAPATR